LVEALQVRLEVHVQPLRAAVARRVGGAHDQLVPDTAPLVRGVDGSVQQERVLAAVPCHIDEPDERRPGEGADVEEATAQDVAVGDGGVIRPCAGKKVVQGVIAERGVTARSGCLPPEDPLGSPIPDFLHRSGGKIRDCDTGVRH
jgi:hypothetical protein